jgi:NADH-quinone oxidoreductase subunit J
MLPLFLLLSLVVILSGAGVVISRNPIYCALSLVLNMLAVAALYAMLDAHFLAAVQIIVYAGAVMVLVIFVLMLLNIQVEAHQRRPLGLLVAGGMLGAGFLYTVVPLLLQAFSSFPDASHTQDGSVKNVGQVLYTDYVFQFEAASLLIMAAIVGAVMLAKRSYK